MKVEQACYYSQGLVINAFNFAHVSADSILISTDFDYPDKVEDLRKPENFFVVIEQSTEMVWGDRLLSGERLKTLLSDCGFARITCHAVQLPGELFTRHVALAWKTASP